MNTAKTDEELAGEKSSGGAMSNKPTNKTQEPLEEKYKKPKSIRGLETYSGNQWHERQNLIGAIGQIMENRGFMPLETPVMEYGEMISDFISPSEVFSVEGEKAGDNILRYDLTAPLARYVAENFDNLPKPFRRYQVGSVFRNDKPDGGRFKQFTQMDADTIGTQNPAADAEMIMMLCECLKAAGLKQGEYIIRVNHRAILEQVFESLSVPANRAIIVRALDKYDRLGKNAVEELLGAGRRDASGDFAPGAGLKAEQIKQLISFLQLSQETTRAGFIEKINQTYGKNRGTEELAQMDNIFTELGFDEERIKFDSSIVRGLDYYTGCVFEADCGSVAGSIGGGGRYDRLLKRFRAEPIGAVGMSVGVSRLHYILNQKNPQKEISNLIVILAMEADKMTHYQQLALKLRAAGLRAETYIGDGKMKQQLKYADKRNARLAIIQGEDERVQNKIIIKDLRLGDALAKDASDKQGEREKAQQTIAETDLIKTCLEIINNG